MREVWKVIIPLNNNTDEITMLNERSLKRFVCAEYDTMNSEIAEMVKEKHKQSQGNSFSQLNHDGATLVNGKMCNRLD